MDDSTRAAFALWTQAQPAVSAYLHAIVGDRGQRDELLQETALAVLAGFDTYEPHRPFLPWALAIARNKAASARRSARRAPVTLTEQACESLAVAIVEAEESERSRLAHLAECMRMLGGRAREICEQRYRVGLPPRRIAEVLGVSPNTVSKALERLRADLRDCITRREAEGGPEVAR
ncbi:MAG: sigma-70 family RNA polymerase sigma factor [Phycisphaerales bacterium]